MSRLARKDAAAVTLLERLRALGAAAEASGRRGQVDLELVSNLGTRFRLRLDPRAWPWEEPRAFVVEPVARGTRIHQWPDGAICFSLPCWNPDAPDVAGLIAALSAWIALYERFRLTGHGWAGEATGSLGGISVGEERALLERGLNDVLARQHLAEPDLPW